MPIPDTSAPGRDLPSDLRRDARTDRQPAPSANTI
jgi:hypothetical protein